MTHLVWIPRKGLALTLTWSNESLWKMYKLKKENFIKNLDLGDPPPSLWKKCHYPIWIGVNPPYPFGRIEADFPLRWCPLLHGVLLGMNCCPEKYSNESLGELDRMIAPVSCGQLLADAPESERVSSLNPPGFWNGVDRRTLVED